MRFMNSLPTVAAVTASAIMASLAMLPSLTQTQQQTYVMKISTPTIHDIPDKWAATCLGRLA